MTVISIFQKHPKLWTGIACCLSSFEVYVLSALLLRGEFLPTFVIRNAYALAAVPTVIVCSAFSYFVHLSLKLPIDPTAPFFGASWQQKRRLIISLRILGGYFSCLTGMCATLFLCANNGPWRQLLDGISDPNIGLPDHMWPLVFLPVLGATILATERIAQGLLEVPQNGLSR